MLAQATARTLPRGVVKTGLLARYRHDEGSGTALNDTSGNGRNATLGVSGLHLPTWNVRGLAYDGTQGVTLPLHFYGDVRTAIFACKAVSNLPTQILSASDASGVTLHLHPASGQMIYSTTPNELCKGGTPLQGPHVLAWTMGPVMRQYIDGVEEVSYPNQGASANSFTPGNASTFLGYQAGNNFQGETYEALYYNRVLSPREIAQTSASLASSLARRGIAIGDTFPASSWFAVFQGDSLTDGLGVAVSTGTAPYTYGVMTSFTNVYPHSNLGLSSQQAVTVRTTTGRTCADPLVNRFSGAVKAYILWMGTNDIFGNRTAAQAYADVKQICLDRRAAGYTHTILADCMARTSFLTGGTPAGQQETERLAFNALLAADFPTNVSAACWTPSSVTYGDYLVRLSTRTELSNAANTTYFADGTHLTATGYAIVASEVRVPMALIGFS